MTPEQKQQQIEQIREHQKRRSYALFQNGRSPMSDDTYAETEFLLSLVKSQEAPPTLMSSEVALKIALHIKGNNSDYFLMREGLAELESIVSKHFANAALSNTAAPMRSACVEKVKETHDSVESACNTALMDVYDLSIANAPIPAKSTLSTASSANGMRASTMKKYLLLISFVVISPIVLYVTANRKRW